MGRAITRVKPGPMPLVGIVLPTPELDSGHQLAARVLLIHYATTVAKWFQHDREARAVLCASWVVDWEDTMKFSRMQLAFVLALVLSGSTFFVGRAAAQDRDDQPQQQQKKKDKDKNKARKDNDRKDKDNHRAWKDRDNDNRNVNRAPATRQESEEQEEREHQQNNGAVYAPYPQNQGTYYPQSQGTYYPNGTYYPQGQGTYYPQGQGTYYPNGTYPMGTNGQYGTSNPAFQFGFQDGVNDGMAARQNGVGFNPTAMPNYQNGTDGYNPQYGDERQYIDAYRQAYQQGFQQGFSGNVNGSNGGYYPQSTYPYPQTGTVGTYGAGNGMSVAQQVGFQDGMRDGQNDRRMNHQFNPTGTRQFQAGTDGYNRSLGDERQYINAYRQSYQQGYQQGYGR